MNVLLKQIYSFHNWDFLLLNFLGVFLIMGIAAYTSRKFELNWFNILFYLAGIPIIFLLGSRLFYMVFYQLDNQAVHLFDLKLYGFSIYGGLILLVLYFAVAAWFNRIPVWNWLDSHSPGLVGYVAFGKTGCFVNGCCFGIPTIMPWGIHYSPEDQSYNYYIIEILDTLKSQPWQVYSDRIHPVQLYESVIALLLLLIAMALLRKKVMPGLVFLLITVLYSLARLGLFYLRANPETGTLYHLLPWLYFIIASLSLGVLLIKLIKLRINIYTK